jgi:hypothetical protein
MAEILKDTLHRPIVIEEGESMNIGISFHDMAGVAITKANLITLTITLIDVATSTVLNSRNGQSILDANGGTVTNDGVLTMRLDAADAPMVGTASRESHLARFTWTWNDGVSVRTGKVEVVFDVVDVKP